MRLDGMPFDFGPLPALAAAQACGCGCEGAPAAGAAVALGAVQSTTLSYIPTGAEGTRATLRAMRDLVLQSVERGDTYELARSITPGMTRRNIVPMAQAVQAWVQQNIRPVDDPTDVEALQEPRLTVQLGTGDCDDQAMLVASLLKSLGINARFHAVALYQPGEFNHVYTEALIPPQWFALETTEEWSFGQQPEGVVDHMTQYLKR